MTEMETDDEGEAILLEKRLIDVIFSWSFKDVLNKDLYKGKVKNIPSTFQSIALYMKSFVFPLIEETHADLSSSFDKVASASTCKILSIEEKESNKPSDKCLYIIEVEKKEISSDGRAYEPETGDLFAITDVRPTCVDDLNRPTMSYIIVLVQRVVQRVTDEKDYIRIQVFSSRPFLVEQDIRENHIKGSLFLVSLINTTTNTRIWNSLSFGLEKQSSQVIQKILEPSFYVTGKEKCNLCLQGEVYRVCRSKILASNWLINLNDSQQEAVLNCLATKYCYHENTTKLIWGPPGTGKTKTVSALLFQLLSLNCRTVTCAPTNIAVLEVSGRVLKFVLESCEFLTYGLGDIVLFGNRKRMNIDNQDELLHIFLDHRAEVLARCFTPASGWKYSLQYLITLFEDTELLYQLYSNGQEEDADAELYQKYDNNANYDSDSGSAVLRKGSLKNKEDKTQRLCAQGVKGEWNKRIGQVIAKTIKFNDESRLGRGFCRNKKDSRSVPRKGCNDSHQTKARLNFEDFVTSRLNCKLEVFTFYVVNFVMHLPTSLLSVVVARDMIKAVNLLHSLSSLLQSNGRSLKEVFVRNKEVERRVTDNSSDVELAKQECLTILKSLPNSFFEPEDKFSIKNQILKNVCLFFCTASSSFKLHETDVELLVIDEAAQLKECESTIPLQIPGLRHAILIGDEWQLPAMVKSKVCEEAKFGRSLFERLALLQFKKQLLNLQYRMHPSISSFPNRAFYQNQIIDAPNVRSTGYQKHFLQGEIYGAYSFINVACGNEEVVDGHSIRNMVEVAVVCEVVANLFKGFISSGEKIGIGIISPYNAQIAAIKENLGTKYSTDDESDFSVDVRSVDGFQGGEKDVIIISAVRSNANRSIGFLSNSQRVNVALTRARHCLWIFGNEATLKSSGSVWKMLIHDARVRGCFHDAQNDKDLVKAMAAALIDIDILDIKIRLYSVLFPGTRWKVTIDDNFWKAMGRIRSIEIRKKAISVLMKLSSDWQWPHTEHITVSSGMSNQLFELSPVDGILHIVLTLETSMETSSYADVMRVWDIRPLTEIPNLDPLFILCKQLDALHLKDES